MIKSMSKAHQDLLERWRVAAVNLVGAKVEESDLRTEVFTTLFKDPVEGVNRVDIANGWRLKADYKYYRTVDEAALPAILERLPEGASDRIFKYKPELRVRDYKALPDEVRHIVEEALVIKPGSPALAIEPPKVTKTVKDAR